MASRGELVNDQWRSWPHKMARMWTSPSRSRAGPLDHGFDTFFGVESSPNYPPYAFVRDRLTVGSDLVTPTVPTGQVLGNPTDQYNSTGPIVPGYNINDTLPTVTNQATAYIGSKANQANPFFAYIPLPAPHHPIDPPPFLAGTTGKGAYGDFIAGVDWAVGQVLDTLNDPNHDGNTSDSIANNTLVVFASDNGADKLFSFPTSTGASQSGVPYRGEKASIYEGGLRVPMLVSWPGHIQAGSTNNNLVELNDFFATAASITGGSLPNTAGDSVNISNELFGTSSTPSRNYSVGHSTNGSLAITQLDNAGNQWKLIFTNGDGNTVGVKTDPLAAITDFSTVQMYNLTADPGEQTNLLNGGGTPRRSKKRFNCNR